LALRAAKSPHNFNHPGIDSVSFARVTDTFRDRLATALAATYRIDDELAGGGMSRVFAATEHALGRKVVVKVLPPELSAGVNRERFQREIQVAAQLQHPHIVPLLSAGRIPSPDGTAEGELLFYTMPFIEGESLRSALARRGRLPVRNVVRIMHDVADALAYAHARGVVHRDIKPGNILTIGSHALVTDFGVAKALSAAMPVTGMTSGGIAIGTPAYMAPEQLAADPGADHRIDIYAVGLLAYELLSGKSPFVGTSPQATMAAQLTRVPDPLDTLRDDVPPSLATIIMRCLEKLPENRPQTASALLDELEGVATLPSGSGPSGTPTVKLSAAASASNARQRRALFAGALLVVVAGVAVALTTWSRTGSGGPIQAVTVSSAPASAPAPADAGAGVAAAIAGAAGIGPTGDSATRTPIMLTRAESLAIAEAVRKRVTARRDSQVAKGERALADSLSRRFERALSDSLSRIMTELRGGRKIEVRGFDPKELERLQEIAKRSAAMPNVPSMATIPGATGGPRGLPERNGPVTAYRGPPQPGDPIPFPPPAPGVRRVLVGVARNAYRRELSTMGAAVYDSIRRAIAAQPGYDVVDAASLVDPRLYPSRSRTALARAVSAGAVLTGLYFPRPDSTIVLQLQLFDVQRNRVARVLETRPIDAKDPMRGVGEIVIATLTAMHDIDWRSGPADSLGSKRP
jgi:serine/threonine protein kinase